ncbi:MAG: bacteriohemerythrin [Rhodocyclaceae bacterium]|jgi:hemerythrin-like metal-binding protein|nr:bacteriohemerythrin [Rhodocyclaceae bacterium]
MSLAGELLTGILEIDEQHETLFDTLETLENIVEAGDGWSAAYFALSELTQFARTHFVVEEALMRLHKYPDIDKHIAEHRMFTAHLALLEQQAIRQDMSSQIIELVRQWLENHIGHSDQAYVSHLRSAPVV